MKPLPRNQVSDKESFLLVSSLLPNLAEELLPRTKATKFNALTRRVERENIRLPLRLMGLTPYGWSEKVLL